MKFTDVTFVDPSSESDEPKEIIYPVTVMMQVRDLDTGEVSLQPITFNGPGYNCIIQIPQDPLPKKAEDIKKGDPP